jgi:glycosyltransferase involved in cell wall biosynthesis
MKFFYILGGNVLYGAENVSIDLIEGLRRSGHEVFCAVATSMPADKSPVVAKLNELGIRNQTAYLGILYFSKIWWTLDTLVHLPGARRRVRKMLEKEKPDVIITPHYRLIAMVRSIVKNYPVIYNVQDIHTPDASHSFYYRQTRDTISLFLACSMAARKGLDAFGIAENKTEVLYNSIDITKMPVLPARSGSHEINIGIIGQIIHRKGHDLLAKAVKQLRQKQLPVKIRVYGNGDPAYVAQLEKSLQEYGIADAFVFEGFVSDKAKIYAELDIVAIPSRNEAFGLVATEPAYYSIPVVASRIDGLQEVVEEGVTGLLFEKDNAEQLAGGLEQLITNATLRAALGKKAREKVLTNFTNDTMAARLVSLVQKHFHIGDK